MQVHIFSSNTTSQASANSSVSTSFYRLDGIHYGITEQKVVAKSRR